MTVSLTTGPDWTVGPLAAGDGTNGALDYGPDDGPNGTYQGDVLFDCRQRPINKDYIASLGYSGQVRGHLDSPYLPFVDAAPVTAAAAGIVAAANVTAVAMTLVTTSSSGVSPGLSIIRPDTGALVTGLTGIEFGVNLSSATTSITGSSLVFSNAQYYGNLYWVGQWLAIANAGNTGGTTTAYCQITAIAIGASNTTLTLSPAPGKVLSNTNIRVGSCSIASSINNTPAPTAVQPYLFGPTSKVGMLSPAEALTRCLSITGVAGGAGGAFICRGYDIFGYPMTETITATSGATVTYGIKAWKYIASITPQFSDAHNYSVGFGDTFGIHVATDRWEYTNLFWNGGYLTASTGWLGADRTTPATAITGDVRGTLQLGTAGAGSGATGSPDGTKRLAIFTSLQPYQVLGGTPGDSTRMYGVAQFAS